MIQIFFFLFITFSSATHGIDFQNLISVSSFECFRKNDYYTFAISRGWNIYGEFDSNFQQNVENARNGGFTEVDGYFWPCYSCGNIEGQVNTFYSTMV